MTIAGYAEKWNAMCADAEGELSQLFKEYESDIATMQRDRLWQGKAKDDTEIIPPYTTTTQMLKYAKNQPTDRVTLKDTGDFYRGIFVRVESEKIIIDSTDKKSEKLKEKYGESIFGLTDENKTMLNHAIIAEFVRWIKSKI